VIESSGKVKHVFSIDFGWIGSEYNGTLEKSCGFCHKDLDPQEAVLIESRALDDGYWEAVSFYCFTSDRKCAENYLEEMASSFSGLAEQSFYYKENPFAFRDYPYDGYTLDEKGLTWLVMNPEEKAEIERLIEQSERDEELGLKSKTFEEVMVDIKNRIEAKILFTRPPDLREKSHENEENLLNVNMDVRRWQDLSRFDQNDINILAFARLYAAGQMPVAVDEDKDAALKLVHKMAGLLDELSNMQSGG
jgi:hypothetical protein